MDATTANTTEFRNRPAPRLAYDDTSDGTLVLRHEFQPTGVYLDSATYGLPPKAALQALSAVTVAWTSGRYDPVSCDQAVGRRTQHVRATAQRPRGGCGDRPSGLTNGRPDSRVPAFASTRAGGRGRLHLAAVSAARRRLRRAHDPAGAARRRGRQPHRPGGRLRRPIRRRTARRFGRHLQRSSQLRRTDVGRRAPRRAAGSRSTPGGSQSW